MTDQYRSGSSIRMCRILSFGIVLGIVVGCNYSQRKTPLGGAAVVLATRESIQQDFVGGSCLRCHTQANAKNRYVDLTDIMTLTQPGDHNTEAGHHHRVLIVPGCPKLSFFVSILKEGKMPPTPDERVLPETIEAIEDWIVSLRPNPGTACDSDEPGGPGG